MYLINQWDDLGYQADLNTDNQESSLILHLRQNHSLDDLQAWQGLHVNLIHVVHLEHSR